MLIYHLVLVQEVVLVQICFTRNKNDCLQYFICNFEIVISPKMQIPLELDKWTIIL